MSEWRDIKTAPTDGTEFLVWCSGSKYDRPGYRIGHMERMGPLGCVIVVGATFYTNETMFGFWQPLPAAPTEDHKQP